MSEQDIEPIWVRPKTAAHIGGFGLTLCYELMNSGRLKTVKVGGLRLVSVESIRSLTSDPDDEARANGPVRMRKLRLEALARARV